MSETARLTVADVERRAAHIRYTLDDAERERSEHALRADVLDAIAAGAPDAPALAAAALTTDYYDDPDQPDDDRG